MRTTVRAVLIASASTLVAGATNYSGSPTTTYAVWLSGAAESNIAHPSGGAGDPDGSGSVHLTLNPATKQICYRFSLSRLSTPLMAHIHQGPPLTNGPPVITLFTGPGAKLADCVTWLHGQLAAIVANPVGFYVDVDTTEFPDGALRGQL